MSKDHPKNRRNRTVWVICLLVLLFGWVFFYQLFGPNPKILVSRETTYITEPLGKNGLPNYLDYYNQQLSKGITPCETLTSSRPKTVTKKAPRTNNSANAKRANSNLLLLFCL